MSLDGRLLADVTVFSTVIESGSFARADEAFGISASGVSHAIARLETRMGVCLIERTIRAMSLTEEGRRFYERLRPSLEEIADAAADGSVFTVLSTGQLPPAFCRPAAATGELQKLLLRVGISRMPFGSQCLLFAGVGLEAVRQLP